MPPNRPARFAEGEPPDPNLRSFVIRIWIEEISRDGRCAKWRGQITRVPAGGRRSVEQLGDITDVIAHDLERLGVCFRGLEWLERLLGRRRHWRKGR